MTLVPSSTQPLRLRSQLSALLLGCLSEGVEISRLFRGRRRASRFPTLKSQERKLDSQLPGKWILGVELEELALLGLLVLVICSPKPGLYLGAFLIKWSESLKESIHP